MLNKKKFIKQVLKAKTKENNYIEIIIDIAEDENLCIYEISDIIKKDKTLFEAIKVECISLKMIKGKKQIDLGAIFNAN